MEVLFAALSVHWAFSVIMVIKASVSRNSFFIERVFFIGYGCKNNFFLIIAIILVAQSSGHSEAEQGISGVGL